MVAEEDWTVISNEPEIENDQTMTLYEELYNIFKNNKLVIENPRYHFFQQSAPISTYLYAIIAGNFVFEERLSTGMPPMRIYARPHILASTVFKTDEIFDLLESGIRFYADFFG